MSKLQNALQGQKEQSPYERFRGQVEQLRPSIAAMCGRENVDRFVRVCLNAAQANPDVLIADRKTLLLACLKAAQDNLLPDGREAVFNIYNTKVKKDGREEWVKMVQYMPMAYGLIQKIYEAGATYVDGVPVYERDDFDYQRGDEPRIIHKPFKEMDDPGQVVAAYVVVKLRSGEVKREVMFRRDIERVRQKSKQPDGLMWKEFYDQAAVKSVVHRVAKQLPRAERLEHALAHDNEVVGLAEVQSPPDTADANLERLLDSRQLITAEDKAQPKVDPTPTPHPGTPAMKADFLTKITQCKDSAVIGIIEDDFRFYAWPGKDLAELEQASRARLETLNGAA